MTVTPTLRNPQVSLIQKLVSFRQAFDFWCRQTCKGFPWTLLSALKPEKKANLKPYHYQTHSLSSIWSFSMDEKTAAEFETLIAFWQWLYTNNCLPDCQVNHAHFTDLKILDVGTKNGLLPLAGGIFWTMNHDNLSVELQGVKVDSVEIHSVEIDSYRLVWDGFSQKPLTRQQQALRWFQEFSAVIPQSKSCKLIYHAGNILDFPSSQALSAEEENYHFITHCLPFVLPEPCLAWGLPLSLFQPEDIFQKLLSLLSPGGCLIIVNQGEIETQAQEAIFQHVKRIFSREFEYHFLGPVPDPLSMWQYPRFAWKVNFSSQEFE